MVEGYLLEVKHDGEVVAYINDIGDFVCLNRERMLRALRSTVVQLQNIAFRLEKAGIRPASQSETGSNGQ